MSFMQRASCVLLLSLLIPSCDISLGDSGGQPEDTIEITVVGAVIDASTQEGLPDAELVVLIIGGDDDAETREVSEVIQSAADGRFRFPRFRVNSLKNRYKLRVKLDGYRENDDTTLFALLPGEVDIGAIRLQSDQTRLTTLITGTVVDGFEGDESPLSGATIKITRDLYGEEALDGESGCEVSSDEAGAFRCEVPYGEYELEITREGFTPIFDYLWVYQQTALGPQRLFQSQAEDDLIIVLDWVSPEGFTIDLDLKLDLADTAPTRQGEDAEDEEGEGHQPILLGPSGGFLHEEASDFVQRRSGFAEDTSYWPFHVLNRVEVSFETCGYPAPLDPLAVDDFDDDSGEELGGECSALSAELRARQHFAQLRRDSKDGTEPEVLSLFSDRLPLPEGVTLPIDQMYAYSTVLEEEVVRHPLAMASVFVDMSGISADVFDGGAPQLPITAAEPVLTVFQGEKVLGTFSLARLELPIGERLARWVPLYIEYGLTSEAELYFELHPVGKVEASTNRKPWVYAPSSAEPGEELPAIDEVIATARDAHYAVTVGRGRDEQLLFTLHEGSEQSSSISELLASELPPDLSPTGLLIQDGELIIGGVKGDGSSVLIDGFGESGCEGGAPLTIFSFDDFYWIGTESGISSCGGSFELPANAPEGRVSVSGSFPNSSWLLVGGEQGLFAIDQRSPDAGFRALSADAIRSVASISGRYVATTDGAVFRGALRQGEWRWTLVARWGDLEPDEGAPLELYAVESLQERLLLVTSQGIVSIASEELPSDAEAAEGAVLEYYDDSLVSFPKEPIVRHITSVGEVAFFYALGALRELH